MTSVRARSEDMRIILFLGLVFIVIGGTVDLILDAPKSWLSFHVVFELVMIAGGLVMTTALWLGWWRARQEALQLQRLMAEEGGSKIERQFAEWQLTPAEKEVAVMLLQGYSHKRIAAVTGRSERTVRQHAVAVYHKAGTTSRAELAAFFLDSLTLTHR